MKTKDLIQLFLDHQEGLVSDATCSWYERYLKPLKEKYGEKECSEITSLDLHSLFVEKKRENYSVYTLANFIRVWKRFFSWANEEAFITSDPAKKIRRPLLPPKSPSAISENDIQKLLNAAKNSKHPQRNDALIRFLGDTGARVGGVAGLRLENLNLQSRRAIVFEKGRGGKKERLVFFSHQTANAITDWLQVRPKTDDTRLFLLQESGIFQVLKRLAKAANIQGRWNPHAFRHAFARRMLAKGMSIGIVSHLMGHSSVQVTIAFYGRFSKDELQEIYDRYNS